MAKQTFTTGQVLTAAQMTSLQQTAMGGGSATAKTASYTLVAADAGATVIMNSASATTITVNTSLFSAGDTVFIQNLGAGVSTITPGTATVNTASSLALAQYESGNLYFTAAGASIFSKADGAASAGGMTLINTFSMSAVSSLSMDNIFSATYSRYKIMLYSTQSVAAFVQARLRVSSSDNTTSNYFSSAMNRTGGSNTGSDSTAATGWNKFNFLGQKLSTLSIDISNPFSSSLNTVFTGTFGAQETNNAEIVTGTSFGLFNDDTSFDGLSLISTGTMTGQVKVYGYPE